MLERFGEALEQCDRSRDQVRLTLEAVRDSLDADAVLWHGGAGSAEDEQVGNVPLSAGWVSGFVAHVLTDPAAEAGGVATVLARTDHLLRHFLDRGTRPLAPWPFSVVATRVTRSSSAWVAALSFQPGRLFQEVDRKVLLLARRMLLGGRRQLEAHRKLRDSLFGLVRCLTAALDGRDPYTRGHSERVARIAERLGRQLELPAPAVKDLYLAGQLHDIGKIGLPDGVCDTPGRLSDDALEQVRQHPALGDRLVACLPPLVHLRPGIRHHHERFDGGGYPDGLAGAAIPLAGRVLAVADSCDALLAPRAYRPARTPAEVEAILRAGAGSQWDPDVVDAFFACRQDVYALCMPSDVDDVVPPVDG